MRYSTVLFDADGTLLDFKRDEREAVPEALLMSGISVDEEQISVYSEINDGLWKQLERGEIERSVLMYKRFELFCERYGYKADAKQIASDYIKTLASKGYLLKGAEEMLASLRGRVRLYLVTNGVEYIQTNRYARSGLDKYFDGIFISESIGFAKPDVRYFEHVAASIPDFDREHTLMVGDSLSADIKGGNAYGLDTCWYNPAGKQSGADAPTYDVRGFDEIEKIIFEVEAD